MTGTKKILRLFLIITACLAIFCIVTPVYASALDTLDLQLPFGELPASLTITGSTIGEYVRAIFLFGSAMLFAVAVVAIMYGGVLWTISGAIPNQIDVAKRTIVQAIVGIFIASFAIFVLQIVSPGTILLQPISPTAIQGIKCCQVGTTNFQLMTASECNAKKGKIVSEGSCVGELKNLDMAYRPTGEARCKSHIIENECTSDTINNCVWKNGACYQDVGQNTPTVCQEANKPQPEGTIKKQVCEALNGCVWLNGGICQTKPGTTISTNPCLTGDNLGNATACRANANCEYYTDGACVKHLDTANLSCDIFKSQSTCPTTNCYWNSGNNSCLKAEDFGKGCNDHNICGDLGFCCKNKCSTISPSKTYTIPSGFLGVCIPRVSQGGNCYNRSIIKKVDDRACSTGKICAYQGTLSEAGLAVLPVFELTTFICNDSSMGLEFCKATLPDYLCNKIYLQ